MSTISLVLSSSCAISRDLQDTWHLITVTLTLTALTLHTFMRSQHSHAVVCNEICSLDTAMGAMGAGGIIEHVTKQT